MSDNAPPPRHTIVITGASAGIGAALALRLAADGHRLALAARTGDALRAVASEAESRGAQQAIAIETDVRRRADVERLRDRTLDAFGDFDVWINNAGRGIARPVLELTDDDVDEMIAVNLKSALYGMQAAVPHFITRGAGHVINVSSYLGRVPLASIRSAYSAAKAALNSLTANLRMDLRRQHPDIHVSLVMPGVVLTDFARNVRGTPVPPQIVAVADASPASAARGAAPRASSMRPQTAAEVADSIAQLIAHPAPELYTNPASAALAARYFADVGAFEKGIPS
ncbi:MAG TPA: SDR family oxidoreductase [Gemmatimonadaceae bacterium]|nr:SDR family oxidoreductase [Gemmatimonadaceae bacterium]